MSPQATDHTASGDSSVPSNRVSSSQSTPASAQTFTFTPSSNQDQAYTPARHPQAQAQAPVSAGAEAGNSARKFPCTPGTECETPVSSPERETIRAMRTVTKEGDDNGNVDDNEGEEVEQQESDQGQEEAEAGGCSDDEAGKDVDYSNWPMRDIKEPGPNDVLYGRGGGTNHHDGNKRYRKMVEGKKVEYVKAKRLDKPKVAMDIIARWRAQKPPGRFLKYDDKAEVWHDVEDKKAREKTSQALREKAPQLRKQQEEIEKEKEEEDRKRLEEKDGNLSPVPLAKSTRFNVPVQSSKTIRKPTFQRVHSLGISNHDPGSLKGFSWDAADNNDRRQAARSPQREWNHNKSNSSHSAQQFYGYNRHEHTDPRVHSYETNPLPNSGSGEGVHQRSFDDNMPSPRHASLNMNNHGSYPTTPAPSMNQWQQQHYYHPSGSAPHSDEQHRYGDNQGQFADIRQTRSAESDRRSVDYHKKWKIPSQNYQYPDSASSTSRSIAPSLWDGYLNGNHVASRNSSRNSGYATTSSGRPFNSNPQQRTAPRTQSYHSAAYQGHSPSYHPQQGQYSEHYVDSRRPVMNSNADPFAPIPLSNHTHPLKRSGMDYGNSPTSNSESSISPSRSIPRPAPIKRDTSHQNENIETKSQVKRMNRQRSVGSRGQNSMSSLGEVNDDMDVQSLGRHLRQSSIGVVDFNPTALGTFDQFDVAPSATFDDGNNAVLGRPSSTRRQENPESPFGGTTPPPALGEGDRVMSLGDFDDDDLNGITEI